MCSFCSTTGRRAVVATALALAATAPHAQDPARLDPVLVSAQRQPDSAFAAPAAISALGRDDIEAAGLQVDASEALVRLPGIVALARQNYAQDLQISIRGFGARSTFGIRGVRLIVDGIPATMPDGQGQASTIALGSAGRIEVLRGPLAQLYGNAAGGVVRVTTEPDAERPTATLSAGAARFGERRVGLKFSTTEPGYGLTVDASQFETGGWREHSAARRRQLNARWQKELDADTHLRVVLSAVDQPLSQDPLGLTRAQFDADPRQAPAAALAQDTRKTVRQQQLGAVVERRLGAATTLTARLYAGSRELDNALAVPPAAQAAPTSSGGIVRFDRGYGGVAAQLAHRVALGEGRGLRLAVGVELDRMDEDRQGYVNDGGVAGALKRDERNRVRNDDAYAQAGYDFARAWTATLGARTSRVRFTTDDRYVAPGNPDDSGALGYHATNPVVGLAWRPAPSLNVYANAGRGFETPTFTELAYRPGGATGLNAELRASTSRHLEAGLKWRPAAGHRVDLALFRIATRDEIVVDSNAGGRSTFRNAGRTRRDGVELGYAVPLGPTLRATLALDLLRARFVDGYASAASVPPAVVVPGNRLPGTPDRRLFAELAWRPVAAPGGFGAAAELVHTGRLYANDVNDEAAPRATVWHLRAGFEQRAGGWRFAQRLRVDNAGDRRHAGSVIVNEANRRYFEAALPRRWIVMATASYEFR